jgi:uncharacterized membrane protein (Fun14 family)
MPPSDTNTLSLLFTSSPTSAFNIISSDPPHLSKGAIIGLCAGIGVVFLALLLNLIGVCILRRRRQQALRRAVAEVEQGVQLNRVLEGESEEQVGLDGKDVVLSGFREAGSWDSDKFDDGRKGMSLPRRVW